MKQSKEIVEKTFTLCKETDITVSGDSVFYLTRDDKGYMVNGSVTADEKEAIRFFEFIISNGGNPKHTEVLRTERI